MERGEGMRAKGAEELARGDGDVAREMRQAGFSRKDGIGPERLA